MPEVSSENNGSLEIWQSCSESCRFRVAGIHGRVAEEGVVGRRGGDDGSSAKDDCGSNGGDDDGRGITLAGGHHKRRERWDIHLDGVDATYRIRLRRDVNRDQPCETAWREIEFSNQYPLMSLISKVHLPTGYARCLWDFGL